MISRQFPYAGDARTRRAPDFRTVISMLAPALAIVLLLFGGGLALGLLQGLGYLPAAGMEVLTFEHFTHVLSDPDFVSSLTLTLYVAITSTVIAAAISVAMALLLDWLGDRSRIVQFVFQIPLTVPHLVVAVAIVFMMSPTGFLSRAAVRLGLLESSAGFPLLVNDDWSIGIMTAYVWKELPFITLMILSVLRQSGKQLQEVGRTLKAGRWQRFRFITLPIIFPSLGAACLIVFAYTFGAYEVPFLLGQTYPMMLPVWAYRDYSDVDLLARPEGIATGILIAVVVMAAVVLSQISTKLARRRGVLF